jgi:hypothetical protein
VVFSVYIGSGHLLDLSTAYTVMAIFNNLRVWLNSCESSYIGTSTYASNVHRIDDRAVNINETHIGLLDV